MPDRPALVGNAADPEQVKYAGRKQRRTESRREELVRKMLSTTQGREFLWQELEYHGIYQDITGPVEEVYVAIGRRSQGLRLLSELVRHDDLYLTMQKEAMQRDEQIARETEAVRTPAASEEKA